MAQAPRHRRRAPAFVRNKWRWAYRQGFSERARPPGVIEHVDGARYFLSRDPIDDQVFVELFRTFEELFFPPAMDSVKPGDLLLDVGAHHGIYAVAALQRYPGAQLIGIEPDPYGFELLLQNIALNHFEPRVELVNAAVASRSGHGQLEQSSDGSWGNRLIPGVSQTAATTTVTTCRLETILKGRAPDYVKSNCEGGEFDLIPQLFELNLTPKIIVLCAHPDAGNVNALVALIESRGYHVRPVKSSPTHPRFVCERLAE